MSSSNYAGGRTDGAREESHAAARGGDGTAARARVRAAAAAAAANSGPIGPIGVSGYVRGKGYSFPRHPPINGLCNSRLCRPRPRAWGPGELARCVEQ